MRGPVSGYDRSWGDGKKNGEKKVSYEKIQYEDENFTLSEAVKNSYHKEFCFFCGIIWSSEHVDVIFKY